MFVVLAVSNIPGPPCDPSVLNVVCIVFGNDRPHHSFSSSLWDVLNLFLS